MKQQSVFLLSSVCAIIVIRTDDTHYVMPWLWNDVKHKVRAVVILYTKKVLFCFILHIVLIYISQSVYSFVSPCFHVLNMQFNSIPLIRTFILKCPVDVMSCITSADVDETRRHEHTWGRRLSGAVHRITRWFCSFKTRNKGVVRDLTWLVRPYIVDLTENQHMGYIYVFASAITLPHTNNVYSNLPSNHCKRNVTHLC